MEIPHYNVIIATPGHSLMAAYVQSLIMTTEVLTSKGITWAWVNRYASHVSDARDCTLGGEDPQDATDSRPLKGKVTYDKIFWIDSDIAWTPEQFMKLYNSDKDIISGAYLQANGHVMAYPQVFKAPYTYDKVLEMLETVEVGAIGFGFVCVKQGVFESLSRPWFQSAYTKMPYGKDGEEIDFPVLGEDYSWCIRVKEAGYKIWFDPTVRVLHHKMMKLTWEGPRH